MDVVVILLMAGVATAVVWGLTETWRHQRRWQRHRQRQNEAGDQDDKTV